MSVALPEKDFQSICCSKNLYIPLSTDGTYPDVQPANSIGADAHPITIRDADFWTERW